MSMPGQLPWQIEIFNKYDFDWVCGGTLVSPTKIVRYYNRRCALYLIHFEIN